MTSTLFTRKQLHLLAVAFPQVATEGVNIVRVDWLLVDQKIGMDIYDKDDDTLLASVPPMKKEKLEEVLCLQKGPKERIMVQEDWESVLSSLGA